jgi:hypothetical protein
LLTSLSKILIHLAIFSQNCARNSPVLELNFASVNQLSHILGKKKTFNGVI